MFSTTTTIAVSLTATADLVRALNCQENATNRELREVRLLERAGELTPYEARLLRDVAVDARDAREARWTTLHQTARVTTFDLETWHGQCDDEVLAIRTDLAASGLL